MNLNFGRTFTYIQNIHSYIIAFEPGHLHDEIRNSNIFNYNNSIFVNYNYGPCRLKCL